MSFGVSFEASIENLSVRDGLLVVQTQHWTPFVFPYIAVVLELCGSGTLQLQYSIATQSLLQDEYSSTL